MSARSVATRAAARPARRRRRLSRWRLITLPVLLGLAVIAYAAYWNWMAGQIRTGLANFLDGVEAHNGTVRLADFAVGGFPLGFRAEATDYALRAPNGIVLAGEQLVADAPPWSYGTIGFRLDQGQQVVLPMGDGIDLTVAAEQGEGQIRLTEGSILDVIARLLDHGREGSRLAGGDLTLHQVRAIDTLAPTPMSADLITLSADQPALESKGSDPRALAFRGEGRNIDLAFAPISGFGEEVARAALALDLLGPAPGSLTPAGLAAWRDAGGHIRIADLALDYGALRIAADGELRLDRQLRPEGQLTAHISGADETIDALVADRVMGRDTAELLKVGLTLMAGPPDATGAATVTAPVTIADGEIRLGPVKLAEVAPLFEREG